MKLRILAVCTLAGVLGARAVHAEANFFGGVQKDISKTPAAAGGAEVGTGGEVSRSRSNHPSARKYQGLIERNQKQLVRLREAVRHLDRDLTPLGVPLANAYQETLRAYNETRDQLGHLDNRLDADLIAKADALGGVDDEVIDFTLRLGKKRRAELAGFKVFSPEKEARDSQERLQKRSFQLANTLRDFKLSKALEPNSQSKKLSDGLSQLMASRNQLSGEAQAMAGQLVEMGQIWNTAKNAAQSKHETWMQKMIKAFNDGMKAPPY